MAASLGGIEGCQDREEVAADTLPLALGAIAAFSKDLIAGLRRAAVAIGIARQRSGDAPAARS
jgi:hypothetical protein